MITLIKVVNICLMQISQKNRFLLILFTESKQLDPAEFTKEHPEGAYKNITSGP